MKILLLGFVVALSVIQINASNVTPTSNMTVQQYIQLLTLSAQSQYNTALSQFNQLTTQACASQEPIFVNLCKNLKQQTSDVVNGKPQNADFRFYISGASSLGSYLQGASDVIQFVQSQSPQSCPAQQACPACEACPGCPA